ncbi:hypothetical protein [Companilactobacillus mishanensis]|uniref:Uncharacterized protein n=1 Tax=Companilactobacillus mishanensis TaxID=2486008 RepID=A0ABW9P6I6_9LACO|nr:hypothetical protein [Companilactobacillus mishanensis]MQS44557.1 hypothetical protein [Companilactobacillus mishanensis]
MNNDDIYKLVPYGIPAEHSVNYFKGQLVWIKELEKSAPDLAKSNYNIILSELIESGLIQKMEEAESLGKSGFLTESNDICMRLIDLNYRGSVKAFLRLCKNFRKLKQYKKEIEYAQLFLNKFQPLYGGTMWISEFEKRINRAEILDTKRGGAIK